MTKSVLASVLDETEERINKRIAECDKIIDDFKKPLDIPLDDVEKHNYFEERISGRLSVANLKKAYEEKAALEFQLKDAAEIRFYGRFYLGAKLE